MDWQAVFRNNHEFQTWNREHFTWLALAACWWVAWLRTGLRQKSEEERTRIGFIVSLLPVGAWLLSVILATWLGELTRNNLLPLHLCYALNFVMPVMLWRRSKPLFDVVYFWVMAACLQALFTPDLDSAFPGWFTVKYWPVHISLVGSVLYAAVVYGFRPSYRGIWLALLMGNLFVLLLHPLNQWLGTNFMYTETPPPGTILEHLGEHYILAAEPVAVVLFHVVYLPVWVLGRRKGSQLAHGL